MSAQTFCAAVKRARLILRRHCRHIKVKRDQSPVFVLVAVSGLRRNLRVRQLFVDRDVFVVQQTGGQRSHCLLRIADARRTSPSAPLRLQSQ